MLETVLIEVAAIINTRPIPVKYKSKTENISISPADVWFGRAHNVRPKYDKDLVLYDNLRVKHMDKVQQAVVESWLEQWMSQAILEMAPRQFWKQK